MGGLDWNGTGHVGGLDWNGTGHVEDWIIHR